MRLSLEAWAKVFQQEPLLARDVERQPHQGHVLGLCRRPLPHLHSEPGQLGRATASAGEMHLALARLATIEGRAESQHRLRMDCREQSRSAPRRQG